MKADRFIYSLMIYLHRMTVAGTAICVKHAQPECVSFRNTRNWWLVASSSFQKIGQFT